VRLKKGNRTFVITTQENLGQLL